MNKLKLACAALVAAASQTAVAGGLLTNTNQNVAFLRNPARDAAIGIDGVYSNPAGVAFLENGFHLSLNLQSAHQTRDITTAFPLFPYNANNPGLKEHNFEGKADAPVIPSFQAAYNKGKWSLQLGFAITGGGGKCEFDGGLGSFEKVVAGVTTYSDQMNKLYQQLANMPQLFPNMTEHQMGKGYSYNSFMRGRQYYYGVTLGAGYKVNEHLAVYGGARVLYGTSNYYGYVKDIKVEHIEGGVSTMENASNHFGDLTKQLNQAAGALEQIGNTQQAEALKGAANKTDMLSQATQDIELNCDQTGWGIAPIIGINYRYGALNLAAKYEFKTRMRLKNKSANSASADDISMLDRFADGEEVAEDSPALLTVGAQFELLPQLRINAGWHHYFDVDTKQYTKEMLDDTNEYLFGAEYDINKMIQVSAGGQRTVYGLKDAGMNDISFNVNSWSFGLGVGVNVTKKVKINAAYFQTLYDDYVQNDAASMTTNTYTRTNRVLGLGVDLKL